MIIHRVKFTFHGVMLAQVFQKKKNLARIGHRMLELSLLHRLPSSVAFSPTGHESDDPVRWYRSHYVRTTRKGKWSLSTHSTKSVRASLQRLRGDEK